MNKFTLAIVGAIAAAGIASSASAAPVVFSGASGARSASASFEVVGGTLTVILTNTASGDTTQPVDILQAVLWNNTGGPALTGVSASLTSGSHAFLGGVQTADTNFGGEYGYGSNLTGALSHSYGITSAGFGIGNVSTFPGGLFATSGGTPPDGPAGGLLSAGDDVSTGNGGVMGSTFVKSSMTFTFSGASNFNVTSISNLVFIYGTALTEVPALPGTPGTPGNPVPLPAAAWTGLAMLASIGTFAKLRKRA